MKETTCGRDAVVVLPRGNEKPVASNTEAAVWSQSGRVFDVELGVSSWRREGRDFVTVLALEQSVSVYGMTAVVEICVVITLELRHAIVHVDGREECLSLHVEGTAIADLTNLVLGNQAHQLHNVTSLRSRMV